MPWLEFLQEEGYRARRTLYDFVVRPFNPRFNSSFLRERWWHQPGDSDLL